MFNKYKFEDVYGVKFGSHGNYTKYPDVTNNEFELEFVTPNNSEEDVRFAISTMAYTFFGKYMKLEIWDGNNKLYESNRSLSMFVSIDGKDPLANLPTGDKRIPRILRTTWLKPNHTYILRAYRTTGPRADNPIGLIYYGTDHNEVEYPPTAIEVPLVPEVGTPTESIKMVFGGVSFTCYPD